MFVLFEINVKHSLYEYNYVNRLVGLIDSRLSSVVHYQKRLMVTANSGGEKRFRSRNTRNAVVGTRVY